MENKSKNTSHPRVFGGPQGSGIRCRATIDPRQRPSGVSQGVRSLLNNGNNEIPDQVRDDNRGVRDDSTWYANGFTLIELLVVVLIIGILAAVAVPQYQKAVWKSKNAQLKTLAKSVAQAEQAHYLANGHYSFNFDELDLDLPLSAPVQSGSLEDKCGFAIGGKDSVRRGKDFEIVLGGSTSNTSYVSVQAVWLKEPYNCTGFFLDSIHETIWCREYHTTADGTVGNFCAKIEKGTADHTNKPWYYYTLP